MKKIGSVTMTWVPWTLLTCVMMTSGCRSNAKVGQTVSSKLAAIDAEATKWKPITFIDKPELQAGTGAMDAVDVPQFSKTDSGLEYRILRKSDGKKPTASDTVTVNYRGWLGHGTVFDSSYERGEPTTFPLKNVVVGWTEGMQLVGEGGMIELQVPSKLGYGEQGSPGSIPPHSNLHFIIELVSVD